MASTKSEKVAALLKNEALPASIAGSRLIGPLTAMNNRGLVVSRLTDDEEVAMLRERTKLNVEKLESRYTSVGNLISANDNGAVISDVFGDESAKTIERTLEVPVKKMRIGGYIQVGAMICATNMGALVHPIANEKEISEIGSALGFEPEPGTVNGGVPFVSSGFVGNSRCILIGNLTRGSELVILNRAFSS